MPVGCYSNSLLFKACTASAHPLPHPEDGSKGRGSLQREGTPAGSVLIGYFSFSPLLLYFCNNFLAHSQIASLTSLTSVLLPVHFFFCSHSLLLPFFNSFPLAFKCSLGCFLLILWSHTTNMASSVWHLSSSDPVSSFFLYLFISFSRAPLLYHHSMAQTLWF